jgi:antitoxin component YwqK of YwqJK toxin-antitoxin module
MKQKVRTEAVLETRQGRTVSRRKEFYQNGNLCSEGTYAHAMGKWEWDVPVGNIKHYNEDGTLKSEEHYNDSGDRDGESAYFDFKGRPLSKSIYHEGKKTKEDFFDEKGLLRKEKDRDRY